MLYPPCLHTAAAHSISSVREQGPILLPILRSGSMMQQVPRPDQEHIYGGGGMHVELCSEDAQRQQWDHECDGPCCHSPKPRKEPTMPLLLQLHPQLKRSLPFIFYTHSFLCALCQSICSSVTSGGSHFAPGIMTTFCTHFLQLTVVVATRSNIPACPS